ncbi:hypothetical protein [Alicyclobacillus fastidiosus]|uniref:hypothetical protein n=1 Tax=Alicyclobacillus fastidiosus TaxID=392011 RepID=UPI0023EA4504|nr:hypothetical protein [Alicyclobacillus fastidiosus]GMA66124.1 hypothetical protein GCM10025859_65660 [Alicyclobacillus fastidiosus]
MERYCFKAAVADHSVYEYPIETTIEADFLIGAVDALAQEYQLVLEDVGRRMVMFVTPDGALIEYDVS